MSQIHNPEDKVKEKKARLQELVQFAADYGRPFTEELRIIKVHESQIRKTLASSCSCKRNLSKISLERNRPVIAFDLDETLVAAFFCSEDKKKYLLRDKMPIDVSVSWFENGKKEEVQVIFRPGLLDILQMLREKHTLGIFTASTRQYADAIIDALDPKGDLFSFRLYREDCEKLEKAPRFFKDLRVLG